MIEHEIWKDIPEYEGLYQVSNLGRIKSLYNYRGGNSILIQRVKKDYLTIGLRKKGIRKWHQVHRLVASAFIPNINNLKQVNHKDENKLNNKVENLEWCSAKYNNSYGTRLARVSQSNRLKKKICKYDLKGNLIATYNSITEATKLNGLKSISSISCCCNGINKTAGGYIYKFERR